MITSVELNLTSMAYEDMGDGDNWSKWASIALSVLALMLALVWIFGTLLLNLHA